MGNLQEGGGGGGANKMKQSRASPARQIPLYKLEYILLHTFLRKRKRQWLFFCKLKLYWSPFLLATVGILYTAPQVDDLIPIWEECSDVSSTILFRENDLAADQSRRHLKSIATTVSQHLPSFNVVIFDMWCRCCPDYHCVSLCCR